LSGRLIVNGATAQIGTSEVRLKGVGCGH
jgi:hypothetical protein